MTNNKPTHIVYHVKDLGARGETDAPRGFWTKVGAAWPHSDAKGFSIVLAVVPLDGRLVLREPLRDGEQQPDVEL